jgi:hypothetical protein
MEQEVTKRIDGRSLRKRQTKKRGVISHHGDVARDLWKTPEHRAKMAAVAERRRGDPTKTRKGIPDGYTRATAAVMWAEATAKADKVLKKMIETKVFDLDNIPQADADRAEAAMHESLKIMFSAVQIGDRLRAAKQVLDFTKAKPEQKQKVTLEGADAWLTDMLNDKTELSDE